MFIIILYQFFVNGAGTVQIRFKKYNNYRLKKIVYFKINNTIPPYKLGN